MGRQVKLHEGMTLEEALNKPLKPRFNRRKDK